MKYYIYQIKFLDNEGKHCTVSTLNNCDPTIFEDNLLEAKAIVFEQAKALNADNEVTIFTESVIDITQVEYVELSNTTE